MSSPSSVIDTERLRRKALTYLDEDGELPENDLELYFMLKKAVGHTLGIASACIGSYQDARDNTPHLARCARRLSIVAEAVAARMAGEREIADRERREEVQAANRRELQG